MSPPNKPSLEQRLVEHLRAANVEALKKEFVSTDDLERIFCNGNAGEMVSSASRRFERNRGWSLERENVKLSWRKYKERIFEAVIQRIERQEQLTGATREKLERLAAPLDALLQESERLTQTLAQSIKLRRTPYQDNATSDQDTMETAEMTALHDTMEAINKLDTDELVDMIFEDQVYLDMLIEERNNEPGGLLDRTHKHYRKHIDHLIDFIEGKTEADKLAKSKFRKQSEAIIWQEIVRGLDFEQKRDLLAQYIEREGPEKARNFISKTIIVGAMSRHDVTHMLEEAKAQPESFHGEQFSKLGGGMDEFLRICVQGREEMIRDIREEVKQKEKPPIQNAIQHFVTFDKILGETVARLGVLTVLINSIVNISDGIVSRGPKESWMTGALSGIRNTLTDKYVIGGLAAAVIGSDIVYPWIEDFAHAPSSAEQEKIYRFRGEEYLHEQADNHHEIMDYFVENYDAMHDCAESNAIDEKRNSFDLWQGDLKEHLKLTDGEARSFGYESADHAEAVLIKMFTMCAKVFKTARGEKLDKDDKLAQFLSERKIYETHQHASHAH